MQPHVAFENKQESVFSECTSRKCILCCWKLMCSYLWRYYIDIYKNYIIDLTCRQQAFFCVSLIQQIEFHIVQLLPHLSSESFAMNRNRVIFSHSLPKFWPQYTFVFFCVFISHLSLFYPLSFLSMFEKAVQFLHAAGHCSCTMEHPGTRISKRAGFSNCPWTCSLSPSFFLLPDVAFRPSDAFYVYHTTIKVSRNKQLSLFPNPQSWV
jgi:hypothetical protein